ncbi:thiol:disulfide interchange protein DsbA/DsbL [Lysobacter capsici]|uniref:thiol:disulfide interchange protein DsbA/DsbL n=1 Tax=Lysobacter capsici TaxID=435897 RepID=UPI00069C85A9|nr:thiol:disulfide interchange protein DsbA/DsbL [Lysobacter capsici]
MKHAVIEQATNGEAGNSANKTASSRRTRPRGALAWVMAVALIAFGSVAPARQAAPVAGNDYAVLAKPVQASPGPGIEVVQVFSYACGACAKFDPAMEAWRRKLPRGVRFQYVPAVFGGAFDAGAKAYYAAAQLGVVDKTHAAIYRAVHVEQTLTGDSPDQISDAYARLGVDRARFANAYASRKTDERVQWARSYAIAAEVDSTPTIIVAGKYKVAPKPGAAPEALLATVDYLIGVERAARAKR